jgi:hypothetical protein
MRAPAAVLCAWAALAGAAPAGCGGGDAPPRRTATAPSAQITIDEPADGQALGARETEEGGLQLQARVTGRAQPGTTVFLNASCVPVACAAQAAVDAAGRWSTRLELSAPAEERSVTIEADEQEGVAAAGSAVATVELVSADRARGAIQRDAAQARAAPRTPPSRRQGPARPPLAHDVLVVGDSLALGMADALQAALRGWRVRLDASISRPLAEGMRILRGERRPPAIVAFSLFTNDDPRSTRALESAVRATAARPGGCAVWATLAAPPVKGVDYSAANQLLRSLASEPQLAPSLQIVDWSAAVARSPSLLAADGVHPTAPGYRTRGRLYAAAIRACARAA